MQYLRHQKLCCGFACHFLILNLKLYLNKVSVLGRKKLQLNYTAQFFKEIDTFYLRNAKNKHYQESLWVALLESIIHLVQVLHFSTSYLLFGG